MVTPNTDSNFIQIEFDNSLKPLDGQNDIVAEVIGVTEGLSTVETLSACARAIRLFRRTRPLALVMSAFDAP